jgi:hypothetical protein
MRQLTDIMSDGNASIGALLKEAFEAGKASAAAEMRAKMEAVLDGVAGDRYRASPSRSDDLIARIASSEGRATPGTVKPAIVSLIKQAGANGLTTDELIDITHFKPNSVRGTVSTLHLEKTIRKIGDRWIAENNEGSATVEAQSPQ